MMIKGVAPHDTQSLSSFARYAREWNEAPNETRLPYAAGIAGCGGFNTNSSSLGQQKGVRSGLK